ncbi:Universal stress protein E [Stieleria maiorica]|uniref:Universal stress protein E n=2 Tax=Stieleria maiorica TaxID=2795974 RepID=A0A5B9MC32_9BACT|nr:Universal stress protein E [Stieleria maiorica]
MFEFNRILVSVDTRMDVRNIVDKAALISQQCGASIKLVDVVAEFPRVVRLMLAGHQEIRETIIKEKRERLSALAESLRERGIDVEIDVLSGTTSTQVTSLVASGGHDLVVRTAKGRDSRRRGGVGTTAMRLLRECPCPVLLIAPNASANYAHVMACVDTSSDELVDAVLNDRVVAAATRLSQWHQSKLSIFHAWSIYGEEFLLVRTRDGDFRDLSARVRERSEKMFHDFLQMHGRNAGDQNSFIRKGEPATMIPAFASENNVDLIVMGSFARSWLSEMLLGSTVERVLSVINCSVLVIKPDRMAMPIYGGQFSEWESIV